MIKPKYTGNKGSFGSFQHIINEMPPHYRFISAFAGSGEVELRKKPAPLTNLAFELNEKTIQTYWQQQKEYTVYNVDGIKEVNKKGDLE